MTKPDLIDKAFSSPAFLVSGFLGLVVAATALALYSRESERQDFVNRARVETEEPPESKITYAAFEKIELGASLSDVQAILGSSGVVKAEHQTGQGEDTIHSVHREWEETVNRRRCSITIIFHNGKVDSKHQYGFR